GKRHPALRGAGVRPPPPRQAAAGRERLSPPRPARGRARLRAPGYWEVDVVEIAAAAGYERPSFPPAVGKRQGEFLRLRRLQPLVPLGRVVGGEGRFLLSPSLSLTLSLPPSLCQGERVRERTFGRPSPAPQQGEGSKRGITSSPAPAS